MFSNYPLDNLSLYSALAGTSIGVVLSLGGLVVSNSKDSVDFFPFFCILTGLWGILGFIEGAIFFSRRTEMDEDPDLNLFETFPKTLILHAVWFIGSLICSIVLYSIWNGQDMFEDDGGKSFGFENGILFAELILAVLPQLVAIGLYFYDRHQRREEDDDGASNKKKHRHKKNKKGKDKKSKASKKSSKLDDDPYGDSAGAEAGGAGGSEGLSDDGLGGAGGGGAGGGTGGLSDEDLEKQPLKVDDYHSEDDEFGDVGGTDSKKKSKDKDEYGDDDFGDEGDHAYDEDSEYRDSAKGQDGRKDDLDDEEPRAATSTARQDQARQGGRGSVSSQSQSRSSSSYSRQPNMIHVESYTRDPRTGREIVSQQEWNSSQGRYEPPQMPPLPPPPRYMTASPTYYYNAPSPAPACPPPQPPQARYAYPPAPYQPQTVPYAQARTPYSPPISPTYTYASPPVSPPLSPMPAYPTPRPVSPPYPYPYGQSPYAYQRR